MKGEVMAVRQLTHIGKTARKVKKAADKGEVVKLPKKALRSGQRHKARTKKPRIITTFVEAPDVEQRANVMIGQDAFRLRSLAQAKILYLYTSAERVAGGCVDGIIRTGRYPRVFRYKPALKYEFLVLVSRPQWDRASDEDRTRIAYHALRHFWSDSDGRWRVETHDLEGFLSEVEFFGLKTPQIKKVSEQLALFKEHSG
jgi:hypothetical protein